MSAGPQETVTQALPAGTPRKRRQGPKQRCAPLTSCPAPLADVLADLANDVYEYQTLVRGETALSNQIAAIERSLGGHEHGVTQIDAAADECEGVEEGQAHAVLQIERADLPALALPFLEAKAVIHGHRLARARSIRKFVRQLPVWPWAERIRGISELGLGLIVGHAIGKEHDGTGLASYATPAKLWKRFGLAVIDGRAQRRVRGDEAERHGFAPTRRAVAHMMGAALRMKNGDGPYRTLYDEREAYERAKAPDLPETLHRKRALRYIEKRFLRDLWLEWRRCMPKADVA